MMSYSRYISLFTKEVVNKNVGPSMFNLIVTGEISRNSAYGKVALIMHFPETTLGSVVKLIT